MYEILVGNKKDNVIYKLQSSWTARVLFAGCCWYLYDLFGRTGLHMEVVFLIFIMGVMLLNLLYMPLRLLGNKQISHGVKFIFVIMVDIAALHLYNHTERISIASIWENMISVVIISLCATAVISALYKWLAVHPQEKPSVQGDFERMDGWEFERWSAAWLSRHGFENVRVTSGSGDYGADVIVTRHFIVDGRSILFSTAKTPLRHFLFADRILLSTKLCSQIERFLPELCVQLKCLPHADQKCGAVRRLGLKLSEKYFRQETGGPAELCCFHTQRVRKRPHVWVYAVFSCSFKNCPLF